MINKSNIGEVTIEEKGFRLTIKQKEEAAQHLYSMPSQLQAGPQPVIQSSPSSSSPVSTTSNATKANKTQEVVTDNLLTIKSPMIGTFYRSPSPDKPRFLEVGDEVSPGKVVCIIEAMKLFNEIESEVKGKLIKVLVEDASPVEYDQPLFLVEPL